MDAFESRKVHERKLLKRVRDKKIIVNWLSHSLVMAAIVQLKTFASSCNIAGNKKTDECRRFLTKRSITNVGSSRILSPASYVAFSTISIPLSLVLSFSLSTRVVLSHSVSWIYSQASLRSTRQRCSLMIGETLFCFKIVLLAWVLFPGSSSHPSAPRAVFLTFFLLVLTFFLTKNVSLFAR